MEILDDAYERLPEIGGILHLEHFNFEMLEHDMATIFFMNGLGLTRDPYRRVDENNMGVNIGLQQFHLPCRLRETPPFFGEIGLIVPDLQVIRTRLGRLEQMGKFEGTAYQITSFAENKLQIISPWGISMILWKAGILPFQSQLGLAYVDIPVEPGSAAALSVFYGKLLKAPFKLVSLDSEATAICTVGPHQYLRFRERELKDYNLYDFHVAYYITNYNEARDIAMKNGKLLGEGIGQVCFIDGPFDPDSGRTILGFQQEWRSVYHSDFMRPLVNRWPIISEPYSDQADILADLVDAPDFFCPA